MKTVAVITAGRSDYSIYKPILKRIQDDPDLSLFLVATGTHLCPEFGMTIDDIEADGFTVDRRLNMLLASDDPASISKSIGIGTIGFSQLYSDNPQIDMLLVLGDRFEMLSAVVSALPFNIPIAHIHGGESTYGLIDESIRHSITKMSHLHFTATEEYANRVIQMGEEPWRVIVTGAPSLDNLQELTMYDKEVLSSEIGLDLKSPFLLTTFHPVTLEYRNTETNITSLLAALQRTHFNVLFTYPNPDTASHQIIEAIEKYTRKNNNSKCVTNLGLKKYFSLMAYASAMVGNSSSGIIEAASFGLPVVNIGTRQAGRVHGENVINVACSEDDITNAISYATDPRFIKKLKGIKNPYSHGLASESIISHIKSLELSNNLIMKKFHVMDTSESHDSEA